MEETVGAVLSFDVTQAFETGPLWSGFVGGERFYRHQPAVLDGHSHGAGAVAVARTGRYVHRFTDLALSGQGTGFPLVDLS
jgi:hypothetical protein